MNLKDLLPKNILPSKQKLPEHFFAINVSLTTVAAALWVVENKKLRILNAARVEYQNEDELPEAANRCLDEALADYPVDPTKVLFGVPDFWLHEDNLKDEYMQLLKTLVKELDVTPLAYVSTSYALSHLYQKQNGIPLTAVLINFENPITVSVVKGGKILGTASVRKTEDPGLDIERALTKFTEIEVLPSKILIYNPFLSDEQMAKEKDKLQSFAWMNNLPFLHLPKIETLKPTSEIESVCLAGASEIEQDVSFSRQDIVFSGSQTAVSPYHKVEEDVHPPAAKPADLKDAGFIEGDIESLQGAEEEKQEASASGEAADFIGDNFEAMEKEGGEVFEDEYGQALPSPLPTRVPQFGLRKPVPFSAPGVAVQSGSFVQRLLTLSLKFLENLKVFRLGSFSLPGLALNRLSLVLGVVAVSAVAAYVFLPKAQVILFIDQKIIEKEAQIIADPSVISIDEVNNKIPGKIVEIDASGSDKGSATGKKTIGDPAKGKVVIYNKTSSPKTLAAGTTLLGSSSINYTLDSSVNVASQSAVEGGISFGKASVSVSAVSIGPEGNLSAGKELNIKGEQVANFSAKVDQDISGGTSKEVTVVTSDDQKRLLAEVSSKLKKQAQEDLQGKLSGDLKILSEGLSESVTKASYSKNVNDSASDFTLNLSAHYKGTAYSHNDLNQLVSKLVETNVPSGYELNLKDSETQSDVVKLEKDNRLVFSARFKARLMPKLDLEKMKQEIAWKTKSQVADIVRKNNETVIGSEIKTSFALPSWLQRMPVLSKNISIEVVAK